MLIAYVAAAPATTDCGLGDTVKAPGDRTSSVSTTLSAEVGPTPMTVIG